MINRNLFKIRCLHIVCEQRIFSFLAVTQAIRLGGFAMRGARPGARIALAAPLPRQLLSQLNKGIPAMRDGVLLLGQGLCQRSLEVEYLG